MVLTKQEIEKLIKARVDAWKAYDKVDYEFTKAICEHKDLKDLEKLKKAYLYAEKAYLNAWGKYQDAKKG